MFWTIQTITSVGYGDTSLENNYERPFAEIVMIMGVILQTVAIGSLISIAALLDDSGEYKDKVETLIYSNKEYDMSVQFYI